LFWVLAGRIEMACLVELADTDQAIRANGLLFKQQKLILAIAENAFGSFFCLKHAEVVYFCSGRLHCLSPLDLFQRAEMLL